MSRGVRWFLIGSAALVTLAGCGRGIFNYAEREPWRREAEVACLNSGTVKESAGVVRISPIEGPGMCGADFPLKVSALGEAPAHGLCRGAGASARIDLRCEPSGAGAALADLAAALIGRRRRSAEKRRADVDRSPPGVVQPQLSAAAGARRAAIQSAGAAGLAARRRPADLQSRTETPFRCAGREDRNRRIAALCPARRRADRAAAIRATDAQALPPLGPPRNPQLAPRRPSR